MERIIHARSYAYAEHHKILDTEQDGFRKYRGTTQSLLRFTQTVLTGFSENKVTLATFIDMENCGNGLQTSSMTEVPHVSSKANLVSLFRQSLAFRKEVYYHLSYSISF